MQEIVLSKVPAIFIPLPFAHNNEQFKNAQELADVGAAYILPQKNLVQRALSEAIKECLRKNSSMKKKIEKKSKEVVLDASDRIMRLCTKAYVSSKKKNLKVSVGTIS